MKYILVTGAAGFIGAALCKKLLDSKINVIGLLMEKDDYLGPMNLHLITL